MAFCHPECKTQSPFPSGHRATAAMLGAKQSPSCHHLSLRAAEADLKAADSKVTSSKADPFLLQNLHVERQGQAIALHGSLKEFGASAELHQNESNAGRLLGCPRALGPGEGSSFICNHYLSWPSGNRIREKRARSALSFPFSLSANANTHIFRLLLCLPMLHHSKHLQET